MSIIGGTAERGATLVALDHSMVFIRRELGTRLRLKRIPDLHVRLDDSIDAGRGSCRSSIDRDGPRGRRGPAGRVPADAEPRSRTAGAATDGACRPARAARPGEGSAAAAEYAARSPRPRRPARCPRPRKPVTAGRAARRARIGQEPVTAERATEALDLAPWAVAVPDAVVDRLRAPSGCSR